MSYEPSTLFILYHTFVMYAQLEHGITVASARLIQPAADLAVGSTPAPQLDAVTQVHEHSLTVASTHLTRPEADLGADATPAHHLAAVDRVLGDPVILPRILGFLDDGRARDLVTALQVSKAFFHGAASTLCRRIEVPQYEYSTTKTRDEVLYAKPCVSCYGEEPTHYQKPRNVTAHRSLNPGLGKRHIKRIHPTYRLIYPSTRFMRELYSHVRVITIEEHDACDRLSKTHPIPGAQTIVVRGGHGEVCMPTNSGYCGFMPQHPFRLVLDGLCSGMLCKSCTSLRLLTPFVETVVLRFRYDLTQFYCSIMKLPDVFKPSQLVLMFPPETSRPLLNAREVVLNEEHLKVVGPTEVLGKTRRERLDNMKSNTFYRLAKACLAMPDGCKIYVVGADHGALHMRGFENHDDELEAFEPLFPRSRGPNEKYVYDWDRPKTYDPTEEKMPEKDDPFPSSYPYACYDQSGKLVSATRPRGPIPDVHLASAKAVVDRRVAIMENLLHEWIDYILDSRLPLAHWEDEKDNWETREAFERHLFDLEAEKLRKTQEEWHAGHDCSYTCRFWVPDVPESDDGDHKVEDMDSDSEAGTESETDENEKEADDDESDSEEGDAKDEASTVDDAGDDGRSEMSDGEKEEGKKGFKRVPVLRKWEEGLPHAKTREEIDTKREMVHKNIRFITLHAYHRAEGNKDGMDDPAKYL